MKILTTEEAYRLVIDTLDEIEALINGRVADLHPSQKWVIKGRILNILFNSHYHFSIKAADELLDKKEKDLNDKLEID